MGITKTRKSTIKPFGHSNSKKCQTPTCSCSHNTYKKGQKDVKPYCPTKFVVIMANMGKSCATAQKEATACPPGLEPTSILQPVDPDMINIMPNVLLCFKVPKPIRTDKKAGGESGEKKKVKKRSKSCELRGGILYKGCACESRNGLQDDCQRSECRGSPECLTKPPTCGPSEFANGKAQTKRFEQYIKIKKDVEQQRKDIANGITKPKQGADKKPAFEYDCITLDALKQGGECPICSKTMDSSYIPKKPTNFKSKKMELPEGCNCCEQRC